MNLKMYILGGKFIDQFPGLFDVMLGLECSLADTSMPLKVFVGIAGSR